MYKFIKKKQTNKTSKQPNIDLQTLPSEHWDHDVQRKCLYYP